MLPLAFPGHRQGVLGAVRHADVYPVREKRQPIQSWQSVYTLSRGEVISSNNNINRSSSSSTSSAVVVAVVLVVVAVAVTVTVAVVAVAAVLAVQ